VILAAFCGLQGDGTSTPMLPRHPNGEGRGPVDDPLERFAGLYDHYYRNVLRYALQHAEQGSAEDVASEAFLIAWRRLPDVPRRSPPRRRAPTGTSGNATSSRRGQPRRRRRSFSAPRRPRRRRRKTGLSAPFSQRLRRPGPARLGPGRSSTRISASALRPPPTRRSGRRRGSRRCRRPVVSSAAPSPRPATTTLAMARTWASAAPTSPSPSSGGCR